MTIKAIRPNGHITKEVLFELGSDPDIKGFVVVCYWGDDSFSCGWSNMDNRDLAFASVYLDNEIKMDLFREKS